MILQVIHWISAMIFTGIFGYAGLYKILKVPGMVEGMKSMGFNLNWTLAIGWIESVAITAFVIGLFVNPTVKNISILVLWPFGIGALTTHFAFHHGISDFRNALIVCILPAILLATDSRFKIIL